MKKFLPLLSITCLLNAGAIESVDTNLRYGFEANSGSKPISAIGAKIHFQTKKFNNFSFEGAIYSATKLYGQNSNVAFLNSSNNSFAFIGEASLNYDDKNNHLKIGRFLIDTPFANSDDIGLTPNLFEGVYYENRYFKDTSIYLLYLRKWAGVDAPNIDKFTKFNGNSGAKAIGVTYEGIENLTINSWYYNLNGFNIENVGYIDAIYEGENGNIGYSFGLQYNFLGYKVSSNANVYGVFASIDLKNYGLYAYGAYNKASGNSANNGLGGGNYFTSCEVLTIADGGIGASAYSVGLRYDLSKIGFENVSILINHLWLKNGVTSKELDIATSYQISDDLSLDLIYAKVGDKINGDNFKNFRAFINYKF